MQNSYDDMEQVYDATKLFVGITAAVWVFNIIDSYIFFPDQKTMNIKASTINKGLGLSVNVNL